METTKKKQAEMIFAYVVATLCAYFAVRSWIQFMDPTGSPNFTGLVDIPLWYLWKRFFGPMLYTAIIGLIIKVLEGVAEKSPYIEVMLCISLVAVAGVWFAVVLTLVAGLAGSWTVIAKKIFFL